MRPRHRTGEPTSIRPRAAELAATQEQQPRHFDSETEISPEDWQGMLQALENDRETYWLRFSSQAMCLAIIAPDRRDELNLDDTAWQGMLDELQIHAGDWGNFADQAMKMTILFPDRREELGIDDAIWKEMMSQLENDRASNWWDAAFQLMRMTILFPDRKAELNIDEAAWQGMMGVLSESIRLGVSRDISRLARIMTILFPDRKAELNIDEAAWQGMTQSFEQERSGSNWVPAADLAMCMTILSADEVRITKERGLELISHPRPEEGQALPPRAVA